MPEYTPELRAKVDVLREFVNDAGMPYVERMGALFLLAIAIAPYTAHIDAHAERIAELERDNARLRKGLDLLERQCAAVANSRSATDNIRFMLSQGLMRARVALKDTAQ